MFWSYEILRFDNIICHHPEGIKQKLQKQWFDEILKHLMFNFLGTPFLIEISTRFLFLQAILASKMNLQRA